MIARPSAAEQSRRRVGVVMVVALFVTGAVVSACGIPTDHSPRALDPHALPAALAQSTTTSAKGGSPVNIYLLQTTGTNERLAPQKENAAYSTDAAVQAKAAILRLISFRPVPSKPGAASTLSNPIPSTVRIRRAVVEDGTLDLDVSGLENLENAQQHVAFAQIVFTATSLPGIAILKVRFSIDGSLTQVPLRSGTSKTGQAVGQRDFQDLKPGP